MKARKFQFLPLAILMAGASINAAPLTWDAGNIANGVLIDAAGGTWDTTTGTPWNNAGSNFVWTQTSATAALNSAIFAGADGTHAITIGAALATSSLTFSNDGYTLSAPSLALARIISNTGGTSIASTKTATIGQYVTVNATGSNTIGGGGTLKISGTGSVYNGNTSNQTTINAGTTVEVGTGGTFSHGSSLFVGSNSAGGTINVIGGAVTVSNNSSNNLVIGNGATAGVGRVTLTSGSITLSNIAGSGLRFGSNGASTGAATATFDLDGGTLTSATIFKNASNTNATTTFNFNGGTLKANVSNATFMTGLTSAVVKAGGAKIDTNNFAITIGQALTHDAGLGATLDGGLVKSGTGVLTLTGANTYTGGTTVNDGILNFRNTAARPAGSTVTVAAIGRVGLGVGDAGFFSAADVDSLFANTLSGFSMDAASGVAIDTTAGNFSYASNQSSTRSLTKLGTNTLTLSGTGTYTGGTTIDGGGGSITIEGARSASSGGWAIGTSAPSTSSTVNFQSGSIVAVAAGKSVQIGASSQIGSTVQNSQTLNVAGTVTNSGTLYVGREGALTINDGGIWTQEGGMSLNSFGGVVLAMTVNSSGAFTYTGSTPVGINSAPGNVGSPTLTVAGGTFTTGQGFTNATSTSTGAGSANIVLSGGGTLKLSADVTTLTSTAGSAFNFQLGTGGGIIHTQGFSTTMDGAINNVAAQTGSLTKTGLGTLTLASNNGYTGATIISQGTLALGASGSINSSTSISVASGAIFDVAAVSGGYILASGQTLSGTGTVAGAASIAGVLAPGNSPGDLGFTDNLSLLSTSTLTIEITGIGSGAFDRLLGDGTNTLAFGGTLALDNTGYTPVINDTITIFSNWVDFGGSFASITGTDLGGGLSWDTGNLGVNGTLTVIPEPGATLLGGVGLFLMLLRRRRDV